MKTTLKPTWALIVSAILMAACSPSEEQPKQAAAPAPEKAEPAPAPTVDEAALKQKAVGSIKALGGALKGELTTAMKAGGPLQALDVCNTKAGEIAENVVAEQGVNVSRTSLKFRNPNNAPTDWQVAVLEDFEARKAAGETPDTLAYSEIVDGEYRFMKAIPTAAVCTNCHGAELKAEVEAKINELYPEDKARGFKEGDIRGAFVVTMQATQ